MRIGVLLVAGVIVGGAGCGGGASTAPGQNTGGGGGGGGGGGATCTAASATATNSVTVQATSAFAPNCVKVGAGTSVTWTWAPNNVTHNVTFSSGGSSPDQASGAYTRAFGTAGSFAYSCGFHAGMNGTVIVE